MSHRSLGHPSGTDARDVRYARLQISRVRVFVIHTNEEMMIARHTARFLAARPTSAAA